MYLFLDTISEPTYIALFDDKRVIHDHAGWEGKYHDFDKLTETIDTLIKKNNINYPELQGIITLIGPGGFTGTRINSLVVNTLAYSFHIPLYPITVGEFFALQNAPLPWLTSITKREVLIWETKNTNTYTQKNKTDIAPGLYSALTLIDFENNNHTIRTAKEYESVIKNITLSNPLSRVQPLYAKSPNITLKN
ncbi:hypothetical protein KA057_04100 [Candidatus Gracilibacteria bacterium]|nr:hypothetical protein [Candidatus Gracilibacteria bacterium]